jgi:hypothetical protein
VKWQLRTHYKCKIKLRAHQFQLPRRRRRAQPFEYALPAKSIFLQPCGRLPSLASVTPWLQLVVLVVLGAFYEDYPFWCTPMAFFWTILFVLGFVFQGPYLGNCGGGTTMNLTIASLFLVAIPCYFSLRAALASMLSALRPLVENFKPRAGQEAYNTKKRYETDMCFLRRLIFALFTVFPSAVVFMWLRLGPLFPPDWNSPAGCTHRLHIGINVSFLMFFFTALLMAAQVTLLFTLCRLYIFRIKVLHIAMERNDQDLLKRELSMDTPAEDRILFAKPPAAHNPTLLLNDDLGYLGHSPQAPQANNPNENINNFLAVYRSIKQEAKDQSLLWSAPIALFLLAYGFVFFTTVLGIIKQMIAGTYDKDSPLDFGILYLFLALAYVVLTLVPVIFINSKWPNLLSKTRLENWRPQERTLLSAYFLEHPLVFPLLGLTFTWSKVL